MKKLLLFTAAIGLMIATSNAQELKTTFASGPFDQVTTTVHEISIDVNVYPNPVIELVSIESEILIENIKVYNILGDNVKSFDNLRDYKVNINLGDLENGIYLININDKEIKRIIKK